MKTVAEMTVAEITAEMKGIARTLKDVHGFSDADADFNVKSDGLSSYIAFSDGKKSEWQCKFTHPNPTDTWESCIAEIWKNIGPIAPADKRGLEAMMRKLGDTIEAAELYRGASVDAFIERIKGLRDDMGARLIEDQRSEGAQI